MSHPLESYFKIKFNNIELLETALTHPSYSNEFGGEDNQRLEFIGDAVVDLLIGEYVYNTFSQNEGTLTKKRSNIVQEKSLSHYASLCHLDEYLKLGKGEEKAGGRNKDAIKCDLFEAFIGAIYIDQGLDACKKVINKVVLPNLNYAYNETKDYKSALQEYLISDKRSLEYVLVEATGKPHERLFTFRVVMDDGIILGEGKGHSHTEAQQNAAKAALSKMAVKI